MLRFQVVYALMLCSRVIYFVLFEGTGRLRPKVSKRSLREYEGVTVIET